jgi:hypothetical protein
MVVCIWRVEVEMPNNLYLMILEAAQHSVMCPESHYLLAGGSPALVRVRPPDSRGLLVSQTFGR